MLDLKVPWQTAYDQPLPSRWEPCACPVKAEWIFNVQTCQKESHFAMHALRHLSRSILAVTWAEGSGSEDLGSYKHLIWRNKSDGINLTSIIQHASADKISNSWNMTCRNAESLLRMFEQWNVSGVLFFSKKSASPLELRRLYPPQNWFSQIFPTKIPAGWPSKKNVLRNPNLCLHQLQNQGRFWQTPKVRHLWPQKNYRLFWGGAEIDSPDVFVWGIPASSKTTSPWW